MSVGMGGVDVSLAKEVGMGMGACIGGEDLDVGGVGLGMGVGMGGVEAVLAEGVGTGLGACMGSEDLGLGVVGLGMGVGTGGVGGAFSLVSFLDLQELPGPSSAALLSVAFSQKKEIVRCKYYELI